MVTRSWGRRVVCGCALVALTGCGGGGGKVQVAQAAVREASSVVGGSRSALELSADDVSRLAGQAGVAESVVRDTAPQLDSTSVWSRSMTNLQHMYDRTPDEVRANLVDLACDGMRGQITSRAQLEQNIAERFTGYTPDEGKALADDVEGLWSDLYAAGQSSDPNLQAGAVLTCFTVQQMVG